MLDLYSSVLEDSLRMAPQCWNTWSNTKRTRLTL